MKSTFRTTIAALSLTLLNPAVVFAMGKHVPTSPPPSPSPSTVAAVPVNAGPLNLTDGNYDESTGTHCGDQVTGVDANTFVLSENMENCTDSGVTSQTFRRTSGTEFVAVWNGQTTDASTIAQCTPTSSTPTPCDSFLYDSHTGKLIVQAGDVIEQVSSVVALSPTSFTLGDTGVQIERNGNVIASIPISDTPFTGSTDLHFRQQLIHDDSKQNLARAGHRFNQ